MLSINDLKIGTSILYHNQPHQVIMANHAKLGRGGGILRTKIKNLKSGTILEKTFAGQEKIEAAELENRESQFLYRDNENFYFMDSKNFEQFVLAKNQVVKKGNFIKEGNSIGILYFQDQPLDIQLPLKVTLQVTYTEPGFRGNTASTVSKPATLETGAQINVPLFINEGDEIVVDTRTGEYVERCAQ